MQELINQDVDTADFHKLLFSFCVNIALKQHHSFYMLHTYDSTNPGMTSPKITTEVPNSYLEAA